MSDKLQYTMQQLRDARIQGYAAGYASLRVGAKKNNPYGLDSNLGREWENEYDIGRTERKEELSE